MMAPWGRMAGWATMLAVGLLVLLAGATACAAPPPAGASPSGAQFSHYRVGNKNVKAIYADGEVIWIGTSGGVVRYDRPADRFHLFDTGSGLLSNGIFFVGRIQGRLTVGTYGGGMAVLDEAAGAWRNYNVPQGLADAFVYDVLEAGNGDLWIATWSGVNRVKGGRLDDRSAWETHTVASTGGGLINDWVYGLAEGPDGTLWLATEGGVVRLRDGVWDNWNHARGLGAPYAAVKDRIGFSADLGAVSAHHARQQEEMGLQAVTVAYNPNYVVSLAVDRQAVWAGTWGGGLARFDGREWRNYTTADGLAGNHVFMLRAAADGTLWIGTGAGLQTWKDGRFGPVLTMQHGLFADNVFSLAIAQDASLWIGSYGGVAQLHRWPGP